MSRTITIIDPLPDSRLSPRESVGIAADLFGRELVVRWAEELLAGHATAGDTRYPDIIWICGTAGWPQYWSRVWGARALLHLGPNREEVVLAATADQSWRVREMALKVIARHALADPDGSVDLLVDDQVERVRIQAWRALGRSERA